MRHFLIAAAAAISITTVTAFAQTAPAPAPAAPAKVKYTAEETDLGTLLDNPATKAIVEKHIPGMTTNDQVDMARGMSLKAIQQYAPDDVTDQRLAAIDADLAKLP
jgi:para-nitrobenzyl esterase